MVFHTYGGGAMKKILFSFLLFAFFCGCKTLSKKEKSTLGNFPPKRLGTVSASTVKRNTKELLPREYSFLIIPENNKLRIHHKLLGDNIWIFFSEDNRKVFISAMEKYLETYKNGLKAPPKKAYFGKIQGEMIWGVLNAAHSAEPPIRFEYDHLKNGRPYFIIANKTVKSEKDGANCPAICAAFSPAQCRKVLELIGEKNITAVIQELKTAFERYDDESEFEDFDGNTMKDESKKPEQSFSSETEEDFD